MKYLLFIFIGFIMISCKKSCIVDYDTSVEISVQNPKKEDLLDQNTPRAFQKDSIKIFFPEESKSGKTLPFSIDKRKSGYVLRTDVTNLGWVKKMHSICIQWDKDDTDILTCQTGKKDCTIRCIKIWLNGLLEWPTPWDRELPIVIIKNPKI